MLGMAMHRRSRSNIAESISLTELAAIKGAPCRDVDDSCPDRRLDRRSPKGDTFRLDRSPADERVPWGFLLITGRDDVLDEGG